MRSGIQNSSEKKTSPRTSQVHVLVIQKGQEHEYCFVSFEAVRFRRRTSGAVTEQWTLNATKFYFFFPNLQKFFRLVSKFKINLAKPNPLSRG